MAQVLLIGGVPQSGKTTLSQRLSTLVDRVFELDFYTAWYDRLMPSPLQHNLLQKFYYTQHSLRDTLLTTEVPPIEDSKRKFFFYSALIDTLIDTLEWNHDTGIIEGWVIAPGYIRARDHVAMILLDAAADELRARLTTGIDPLNDDQVSAVLALHDYLTALAYHADVPVLSSSTAESYITELFR